MNGFVTCVKITLVTSACWNLSHGIGRCFSQLQLPGFWVQDIIIGELVRLVLGAGELLNIVDKTGRDFKHTELSCGLVEERVVDVLTGEKMQLSCGDKERLFYAHHKHDMSLGRSRSCQEKLAGFQGTHSAT